MAQEKRDYYEVLGVSKTATDAEIKKARPLNVSGQMVLRRQYSIPFRAGTPFW